MRAAKKKKLGWVILAGSSDVCGVFSWRIALHCEVCLVPRGLVRNVGLEPDPGVRHCFARYLSVGKVDRLSVLFFSFLVLSLILRAYARWDGWHMGWLIDAVVLFLF